MKIAQLTAEEVLTSLRTSVFGLDVAEAQRRLREYGANRICRERSQPAILRLLGEFSRFFSMVLWIAAGLAFFLESVTPGQGMARLGVAIVAVILVSGGFSFWQEFRVERTLAALRSLLPLKVTVMRGGQAMDIEAEQLVPGDLVLFDQGDSVPADCRLIEAFGLLVNNASVTGESAPQPRDGFPSDREGRIHGRNILLAGTSVAAGRGKAVVFATGMHTEFGKIAHLTQSGGRAVSPLRREIGRLSRTIILLAVVIAVLLFTAGWLMGLPLGQDFIFAIGIIVAMVPEGLQPTLTLALVLATQRMARRNVLIRHLPAVEVLGATTIICTDKTGTLTENRMTVVSLLLGAGDRPVPMREALELESRYRQLFFTTAFCHDLVEKREDGERSWQGDPMEVALLDLARKVLGEPPDWPRIDEYPFDAERMRLSTIQAAPEGATLYCKGAPERVLPCCVETLCETGVQPLTEAMRESIVKAQESMAEAGLRVLALAYRSVGAGISAAEAERDLVFAGLVGLEDPPRVAVPKAMETCRNAGIRVIMITGDHPRTALAMARQIGLADPRREARVIVGDELQLLSDTQLQLALDHPDIIFARVAADQKTRIVESLARKGHIVAVTGDGVNDAPALKSAHIGIAMGRCGTDVAKEAADIVLMDDNFASIVSGIEEGRAVFDNIRKFLTYILAHNVPELAPYLAFALFSVPLAITPIQMLAVDMGTDSLTALGLGVEPPEPDVMMRPPRPPLQRLLDPGLALRAYLFLGMIEAAAVMTIFLLILHRAGWHHGEPLAATDPLYLYATMASLGTIVLLQIINVFLCRSPLRSIRDTGLTGNWMLLAGVLVELGSLLLIGWTEAGNDFFGTATVAWADWLRIVPFAVALLVAEETRKWLARRSGS